MFDIPGAKRVKRSKLFSSNMSSEDEQDNDESGRSAIAQNPSNSMSKSKHIPRKKSGSPVVRHENQTDVDTDTEQAVVNYGFDYEFVDTAPQSTRPTLTSDPSKSQNPQPAQYADLQEQSFEFNLFAPKATNSKPTSTSPSQQTSKPHKITLRAPSPSPSLTGGPSTAYAILHPRPLSFYLTAHLPSHTRHKLQLEYSSSAISPSTLSHLSQTSWPGCSLPWRTIHISQPRPARDTRPVTQTNGKARPRPSKKRRIQVRQRQAARRALADQARTAAEADRDKRTRRNREKKVKRKMREKAKKAEVQREGESGEGEGLEKGGSE